ncbi:MAG TPA: SEC-C metal-binding domain-containing protein [Thermoanaerobaculia bacterium]|nr:SEC-C metal-binding domain-containing protein [Thermoanaerobaculia bacterium]
MTTIARNDPCPCGSGEKYKKCCLKSGGVQNQKRHVQAQWLAVVVVVAALAAGILVNPGAGFAVAVGGGLIVGALIFFSNPPPPRSGGSPGAINFGR